MELTFSRSEKKGGLFGGQKYVTTVHIVFSDNERQYVKSKRIKGDVLYEPDRDKGPYHPLEAKYKSELDLLSLLDGGWTIESKSADDLRTIEAIILDNAKRFQASMKTEVDWTTGRQTTFKLDDEGY